MTVSTTKASDVFPGNGVTTGFDCAWRIFDDNDIVVSLVDQATGDDTPMVLNTDYTISGAGDQAGFTVGTVSPVATGTSLYVRRALEYKQPTDFTNQGAFFPTMHEDAMDRLEMHIQQQVDGLDRSLKANAVTGHYVAGGKRITGLADGVLSDDVATVAQVASAASAAAPFLQEGTGAIPRSIQDKGRDVISVKDFGAKGDGVTDDSAAVQKVIDDHDDGTGVIIYFPKGDYLLDTGVGATREGVVFAGAGRNATRLFFTHTDGPGVRFQRQYCGIRDMQINASGDRLTAAAGSNYGVQLECEDVVESSSTRMRQCLLDDVEVINQPSHGVLAVGPALDGSSFNRVRSWLNGGHGIAVERGYLSGRVNKATTGVPGVLNINNCVVQSNGGHGVALGHPDDTLTTPALRIVVENLECSGNATDSAMRYSTDQCWARGSNIEFRASVYSGDGTGGSLYLAGRNMWARNTRSINCTRSVTVGNYAALPTQGVYVDGLTVLGLTQAVAVVVESGASNVSVRNGSPSNITKLITDGVPGSEIASVPQIISKSADQSVNNSTTLVTDNDLKFYVAASEKVYFEMAIEYSSAAGADLKVAITGPTGASVRYGPAGGIKIAPGDSVAVQNEAVAYGTEVALGASTSRRVAKIVGSLSNGSTEGYLALQFAQNVAVAGNTVVYANTSVLTVWRK